MVRGCGLGAVPAPCISGNANLWLGGYTLQLVTEGNGVPSTVVIVDDNNDVRFLLKLLLQDAEGIEVVADASSGEEGVDLVKQHRPDFVVLDCVMPGISGDEVARQIRSENPDVRIISFSAASSSQRAWADAILPKEDAPAIVSVITQLARA